MHAEMLEERVKGLLEKEASMAETIERQREVARESERRIARAEAEAERTRAAAAAQVCREILGQCSMRVGSIKHMVDSDWVCLVVYGYDQAFREQSAQEQASRST